VASVLKTIDAALAAKPTAGVGGLPHMPKPETLRSYAKILENPQRDARGIVIPTGEVIEAACAALRYWAALSAERRYACGRLRRKNMASSPRH
jgi:hypothetical protein